MASPPNAPTADLAKLARDPAWLVHRHDAAADALHLVRLDREGHRKVTFLNDEYLGADLPRRTVPRPGFVNAAPTPAPIHFILHSAFCLSTVLVRALDLPGIAMGLKEPMLLQDVVGFRRRGGPPAQVGQLLDQSLRLLARPFTAGEAVVVKPSNVLNSLGTAMLTMRPDANALLLHAPLRTFLTSVAKKGMWGRLWVRELLVGQLQEGLTARFGFDGGALLGQTDLQVAAVGWLVQHALFADMVGRFGPARVRTLDSETLLAHPREAVGALLRLYRLPDDTARVEAIVTGPAFTRHSKSGEGFGASARAEEYRDAASVHGDEIDKVAQWAEAVAATAGVAMVLPAPLLG